jgi:hypothetical protein
MNSEAFCTTDMHNNNISRRYLITNRLPFNINALTEILPPCRESISHVNSTKIVLLFHMSSSSKRKCADAVPYYSSQYGDYCTTVMLSTWNGMFNVAELWRLNSDQTCIIRLPWKLVSHLSLLTSVLVNAPSLTQKCAGFTVQFNLLWVLLLLE